jgi:hypothetical protein
MNLQMTDFQSVAKANCGIFFVKNVGEVQNLADVECNNKTAVTQIQFEQRLHFYFRYKILITNIL